MNKFLQHLKYTLFNKVDIKITLIDRDGEWDTGVLPRYAHADDACMDVIANEEVIINPKQTALIPLGIAVEIPKGFELQIRNRSSLGKKGLIIPNGVGTIDAGYRGEIHMMLYNSTSKKVIINKGDRVGQIKISKAPQLKLRVVKELSETKRGSGGFGSTGR